MVLLWDLTTSVLPIEPLLSELLLCFLLFEQNGDYLCGSKIHIALALRTAEAVFHVKLCYSELLG